MRLKQTQTQKFKVFAPRSKKENMIVTTEWEAFETIRATLQPYRDMRIETSYGAFEERIARLICEPSITLTKGMGVGLEGATVPEYIVDDAAPWPTHHEYLLKVVSS